MASTNVCETNRCLMSQYNFFEKLFFWWLKDVVCQIKCHDFVISNFRYTLTENHSESLTNTLERMWHEEKNDALSKKRKPSLWKAIVKTYFRDFMKFAIFATCSCIILYVTKVNLNLYYAKQLTHETFVLTRVLQPQLLKCVMSYFEIDSKMSTSRAYAIASLFVALMLLHVVLDGHGEFQLTLVGTRAKIATSGLIYRKMLRLPSSASHHTGSLVINLLSADVAKFECLFYCIPYIIVLPLQVVVAFYFIWQMVGFGPAAIGIALVIIQTLPMKVLYYKISTKLRMEIAAKTDERVSLIREVVDGISAVKLNVWETYFEKLVVRARRSEIGNFLKMSYITSAMWVLATSSHRLCSLVVAMLYISQYGTISAIQILPVNLHFFNLRSNFIYFFFGARTFVAMHASVKRIEEFLLLEEVETKIEDSVNNDSNEVISIKNMTASWDDNIVEKALESIDVGFQRSKLYAIVGSPKSGKSTLLKIVLRELRPIHGEVFVGGKVSYASHDPWLFTGSIRDNILFGEVYDQEKYDKVITVCALTDDFDQLPDGDKTLTRDRNIKLSESQCAKINMARTVYKEADIYLFDNPLSTVDMYVTKVVMDNCINGLLKDKTRLFVTNDLQFLSKVDEIVLLDHGTIEFKGSLLDFQKNAGYFERLVDGPFTVQQHETSVDDVETAVEDSEVDDESDIITNREIENNVNVEPKENDNFIHRRVKNHSVYKRYVEVGSSFLLTVSIAFNSIFVLSVSGFDFQLALWDQHEGNISKTINQTRYPVEKSYTTNVLDRSWILCSLIVLIVFSATCKNIFLYKFIFNANEIIHNNIVACLIRTSLQFFEINPSERILNLFSKITDNIDSALAQSLFESVQTAGHAIAIILPIYLVDWRYIFPTTLALYFYMKISKIYVSCIHKLKKLVAKGKHSVLSFVLSSLEGLATIRAYKADKTAQGNFDNLQDRHTIVHFLAVALVQGFSFWMYLITVGLFALILFGSIALKNESTSASHVGLALMQLLCVGFLIASVVGYFVETMSAMTSVGRMLQFAHLETETSEGSGTNGRALESGPEKGEIEFRQFRLRHIEDGASTMRNVNFVVKPGTKVNIFGPSGAGISPVVKALYRLAEFDGHILIDNVDIEKVSLADLRSRISVIPREPVLFSSSLRKNLDPLNEFDDESLWSALDDVELKHKFRSLDYPLHPEDSNLNKNHRCLLGVARAILKKNKVLVLNEVMDNVDSGARALIHNIVATKFKECTVLIIDCKLNNATADDEILITGYDEKVCCD